jgi:hypothetical protein
MLKFRNALMLGALGCVLAGAAQAQVTREGDVSSIAGRLDLAQAEEDEYTFRSNGGEIVFADIDATIYERVAGGGGHEELVALAQDDEGGCAGGGPGLLCLEVLDSLGGPICTADRPPQPGWQRDPAVFCPLDDPGEYTLRVKMCEQGDVHDSADQADEVAYLLNVSLRGEAPEGNMNRAIAQSRNNLP